MRVAIMQPYFLPYIGYFQLIASCDQFIIYDNIKYTKKGWINRNRYLLNGADATFTIPLAKASDNLNVIDRSISEDFDKKKLISQLHNAYRKSPQFNQVFPLISKLIEYPDLNLFNFIYYSIKEICGYLEIKTNIIISSSLNIDHSLQSQDKVIALVKALAGTEYINPIGGIELYSKEVFKSSGIKLSFLKAKNIEYSQFNNTFIPWLSILDVLMFNSKEQVISFLEEYVTQ